MILAGEEQKNLRQRIVRGLSRLQDVNPQSSDELFLLANPSLSRLLSTLKMSEN
jgi:hypothetical protein